MMFRARLMLRCHRFPCRAAHGAPAAFTLRHAARCFSSLYDFLYTDMIQRYAAIAPLRACHAPPLLRARYAAAARYGLPAPRCRLHDSAAAMFRYAFIFRYAMFRADASPRFTPCQRQDAMMLRASYATLPCARDGARYAQDICSLFSLRAGLLLR